jgi:hypothetical protein
MPINIWGFRRVFQKLEFKDNVLVAAVDVIRQEEVNRQFFGVFNFYSD